MEERPLLSPKKDSPEPVVMRHVQGPLFAGTSLPPLSPPIKFFMNNVSFFGLDWVEGLKNLSITPLPLRPLLPLLISLLPL